MSTTKQKTKAISHHAVCLIGVGEEHIESSADSDRRLLGQQRWQTKSGGSFRGAVANHLIAVARKSKTLFKEQIRDWIRQRNVQLLENQQDGKHVTERMMA